MPTPAVLPDAEIPQDLRRNWSAPASNHNRTETSFNQMSELASACQQGDRAALRQLYDLFHRRIFSLVLRMVGAEDAPDVTQQVFLQTFRSIGQFTGRARIETWLYRLAVNESLQHLRRKRRWRHHGLDWEPMEEPNQEQQVERKELLEHALARIDPELRSNFLLRELEGLSYREIAETLQVPEGTVGSRLNRARNELKERLSDLGLDIRERPSSPE